MGNQLIPNTPQNWHYVGRSRDFKKGKVKTYVLSGKKFAFFRDENAKLRCTSSRCPHMGADLGKGTVKKGCLRCPYHNWAFDGKGRCVDIPSENEIPTFAKIKTYPVIEVLGHVFLWNGDKEKFNFPFFDKEIASGFMASSPAYVHQTVPWYTVPANAFDANHFLHVHDRKPLKEPKIIKRDEISTQIEYDYEIVGKTLPDRIISFIFGKRATLNFTTYMGSLVFAKTKIGKLTNHMIISVTPNSKDEGSKTSIICLKKMKGKNIFSRLWVSLTLKLQVELSRKFFQKEAEEIDGVNLRQKNFVQSDAILKGYLEWLYSVHAEA